MRKYFFALLMMSACFWVTTKAQETIPEFGKIDMADMLLKECPFDKSASAMNLIKTSDTKVIVDPYTTPKVNTQYRVRIKIFDEKAFDKASISIPYVDSRSVKITDIDAFIYNIDEQGKITAIKLDKDQVFREKGKGKKAHNSIRFTFPGLVKGSVIEYRYTRIDKDDASVKPWFFQDALPTRFTKCIVTTPSFAELEYHIVANKPVEKDSSEKTFAREIFNESTKSFAMHDVAAFKIESMMGSLSDNLQRIEFALLPNSFYAAGIKFSVKVDRWPLYNTMLLKAAHFGAQFDVPVPGTGAFMDSVAATKDTLDKIKQVYEYVKRNVNWNGEQMYFCADINECWKDKSGSSGEMNVLLFNLLKKAGILCYPVLISTRENGILDESFPSLGQFNGVDVLAVCANTIFVLDATQKNLAFNITPLNVLNAKAFLIDKERSQWIKIADARALMNTGLYLNAMLDSTGELKGSGVMMFTGVAKAEKLRQEQDDEKSNSKELVDNDNGELKIDSVETEHQNDDADSLIEKIRFHNTLSNTANLYFLNPYMFSMFKKNPFKDSIRLSDIDFGCNQVYTTRLLVAVPGAFSIEDLPKSLSIRMEDSSIIFTREILSSKNQIMMRNSFTVNRAQYDKEEYGGLKSFFDKVYALINEQIILKKKVD